MSPPATPQQVYNVIFFIFCIHIYCRHRPYDASARAHTRADSLVIEPKDTSSIVERRCTAAASAAEVCLRTLARSTVHKPRSGKSLTAVHRFFFFLICRFCFFRSYLVFPFFRTYEFFFLSFFPLFPLLLLLCLSTELLLFNYELYPAESVGRRSRYYYYYYGAVGEGASAHRTCTHT